MAVRTILNSDTLEVGFRIKYNETVQEIIESAEITGSNLVLSKVSGGQIIVDLSSFITHDEFQEILDAGVLFPAATESQAGVIRLGTQEEVGAGENDSVAVTPSTLNGILTSFVSISIAEADFTSGLYTLSDWQTTYAPLFGEYPSFQVVELIGTDERIRMDIYPLRVMAGGLLHSIQFEAYPFNGKIIIKR